MNKQELLKLHRDLCAEALNVMVKKNADYTGANPDPFANFRGSVAFGIEPEFGLMFRLGDKLQRVKSFIENGILAVSDEDIRDIAHDMINYSVLLHGLLLERQEAQMEKETRPVGVKDGDVVVASGTVDRNSKITPDEGFEFDEKDHKSGKPKGKANGGTK